MTTSTKYVCPHCGNADQDTIQGNGASEASVHLTLLCVARVRPEDWSFASAGITPDADQLDANGLVECGHQWNPNDPNE